MRGPVEPLLLEGELIWVHVCVLLGERERAAQLRAHCAAQLHQLRLEGVPAGQLDQRVSKAVQVRAEVVGGVEVGLF